MNFRASNVPISTSALPISALSSTIMIDHADIYQFHLIFIRIRLKRPSQPALFIDFTASISILHFSYLSPSPYTR
jgi:hypothetical protein